MQEERSRIAWSRTRADARIAPSRPGAPPAGRDDAGPAWPSLRLMRRGRAVRRGAALLLWTFTAAAVQSVCVLAPGRAKVVFARLYWAGMCRLLGLRVRVLGETPPAGRAWCASSMKELDMAQ